MRNLFCDDGDLRSEADVSHNFARRLIGSFGYSDKDVRPESSLERLVSGNVGINRLHRPDFAMKSHGHIRWILEAKEPKPGERLDRHFAQANGYCEAINDVYSLLKPVEWFVLTNGHETQLYRPGNSQPVMEMLFSDFAEGNPKYQRLTQVLHPDAFQIRNLSITGDGTLHFRKPTIAEINSVFAKCHQHIHQSDHISQAAGFVEFVKLITLKLLSDKKVKDQYPGVLAEREFDYPSSEVTFSLDWVNVHSASTSNPVDTILFKDFMDDVEKQIARRVRKRFFDIGEHINLKPETIRGVVERLESLYLFGIDADLNGRLFENFCQGRRQNVPLG